MFSIAANSSTMSTKKKAATKAPSPMAALLGPKLVKGKNTVDTDTALGSKPLVALYFSASWCPPCKSFSPVLKEFYNATSDDMEVVYVSSDRSVQEFDTYFAEMPWLAIPITPGSAQIKQNLSDQLKVTSIPTMVILETATGHFISNNGRGQVQQTRADPSSFAKLIQVWKDTQALPFSEANMGSAAGGVIQTILGTVLRNPAFLIALVYGYKYLRRWYREKYGGDAIEPEL